MHCISVLLGSILLLAIIDFNSATKHHRDRGGNRREHESLLDKQERERENKDRKKDENSQPDINRNLTCYQCDGDSCRDPFKIADTIQLVQCEHSCWKGVFAASVRRSCGNKRCGLSFQGSSAISNTCCQTAFCNHTSLNIPAITIIFCSFLLLILTI